MSEFQEVMYDYTVVKEKVKWFARVLEMSLPSVKDRLFSCFFKLPNPYSLLPPNKLSLLSTRKSKAVHRGDKTWNGYAHSVNNLSFWTWWGLKCLKHISRQKCFFPCYDLHYMGNIIFSMWKSPIIAIASVFCEHECMILQPFFHHMSPHWFQPHLRGTNMEITKQGRGLHVVSAWTTNNGVANCACHFPVTWLRIERSFIYLLCSDVKAVILELFMSADIINLTRRAQSPIISLIWSKRRW